MKVGALKHKVVIKTTANISDGQGGILPGNTTISRTTNASIKPMDGRRAIEYTQVVGSYPYEVVMRHRPDITITKDNTIEYNGKEFFVHSVIQEGEGRRFLRAIVFEKDAVSPTVGDEVVPDNNTGTTNYLTSDALSFPVVTGVVSTAFVQHKVFLTNASGCTVTLYDDANNPYGIGTKVTFVRQGGEVSFQGGGGNEVIKGGVNAGGEYKIPLEWGFVTAEKIAANTWYLSGDLEFDYEV